MKWVIPILTVLVVVGVFLTVGRRLMIRALRGAMTSGEGFPMELGGRRFVGGCCEACDEGAHEDCVCWLDAMDVDESEPYSYQGCEGCDECERIAFDSPLGEGR